MMVALPKISVVTPSYNQAAYLERTIRSVLDQGYPNTEYIIIDGGSTDGSVEIIKKYAERLAFWVSEPDQGQAHAINKGLKRATGDWVAWQNSDDVFYPGAFHQLALAATKQPNASLVIGNMNLIDETGKVLRDVKYVKPTYEALLAEGMVLANQATFWRRNLHTDIGYISEELDCAFDYEWFLRILNNNVSAFHVNSVWGALRYHEATKTSSRQSTFDLEFDQILMGRRCSSLGKRYYQLRRLFLLCINGEFGYVSRGLIKRMNG